MMSYELGLFFLSVFSIDFSFYISTSLFACHVRRKLPQFYVEAKLYISNFLSASHVITNWMFLCVCELE